VEKLNAVAPEPAVRQPPQFRSWLERWRDVIQQANWKNIRDVRRQFPHADAVTLPSGTVVTVFNVSGNKYRLLTTIAYPLRQVYVLDVLTHSEYDKEKWKQSL
jgi:mRNA interferase HigB